MSADVGKTVVGGRTRLDSVVDDLAAGTSTEARPGKVSSPGGTARHPDNPARPYGWNPDCGKPMPPDVDGLFGATQGYIKYKSEKFEHRLVLWYRLQGYNGKETAQLTGYTEQSISWISKQPWFQKAFCELAEEIGKNQIETFLEGHVMPAIEKVADLVQRGDSDSIKLAAAKEILDRYLGKSVAKTEIKSDAKVDVNVFDGARLQLEYEQNQKILASRGVGSGNN